MATTVREVAELAAAYAQHVANVRAEALGADGAALSDSLSGAATIPELRAALTCLYRALLRGGVVNRDALVSVWGERCKVATQPEELRELLTELEAAEDARRDAPWRTGPPPAAHAHAHARGGNGAGPSVPLDAGLTIDLLDEHDAEVDWRATARKLAAQNAALQAQLRAVRSGGGGASVEEAVVDEAGGSGAGPSVEVVDLCSSASDGSEDDNQPITISTDDDEADEVDDAPSSAPSAVLKSEAAAGAYGATASAAQALADGAAPPEKQRRKRRRMHPPGGDAAGEDAAWPRAQAAGKAGKARKVGKAGRNSALVALMNALKRGHGALEAAHAAYKCAGPLHLLGDHQGVSCLHAAACSDATAPVLALVLAHARARGPAALAHALTRSCAPDAPSSPFSSVSALRGVEPEHRVAAEPVLSEGCALHFAALHNAVECAALLVAAGGEAVVSLRSARIGDFDAVATPLDVAAAANSIGVMRLLLRNGAKADAQSEHDGYCALHWAAENAKTDAVRLLLVHAAQPDAVDGAGLTAIDWAVGSNNGGLGVAVRQDCHDDRLTVLVELAHAGAKLNLGDAPDVPVDTAGYTRSPLHACAGGLTDSSLSLLRRLLKHPSFDINIGADADGSPLDLAVHVGWPAGVLMLLNRGADGNSRDRDGSTPLMRAASLRPGLGGSDLIRMLKLKGATLDLRDSHGRTAAHYAARHGHADALRTLRALGADLKLADSDGATPEELTVKHHSGAVRTALLAVLRAPACPPRVLQPGEDVFDQEEVAITVAPDAVLPDDIAVITTNVELALELKPRKASGAKCCDCVLCVPGLCPCLKGCLPDLAVDVGWSLDWAREAADTLTKPPHAIAPGRAVKALLRQALSVESTLIVFATARQLVLLKRGTEAERINPMGDLRVPAVGLAVQLVALRALLAAEPLLESLVDRLDATWVERAKAASAKPGHVGTLLLELDDATSVPLLALCDKAKQHRTVPAWQARQAAAWFAEARPRWRASVRIGVGGVVPPPPPELAEAMRILLLSLRSVCVPLRVEPKAGVGIPELQLCSPGCTCAGGGCTAAGVMYPLTVRPVAGAGLGVFASSPIPKGAPVAPYCGELTTSAEADRRAHAGGPAQRHFYDLDLEASQWRHLRNAGRNAVITGSHFSNVVRFFNHGCSPNLGRASVDWPGLEAGPLAFLYALTDIEADAELTWDYFSKNRTRMGFDCACTSCKPPAVGAAGGALGRGKQRMPR